MNRPEARARFLQEYRQVRLTEGRGSADPTYYSELPFRDITARNSEMWAMRARTYTYFERNLLSQWERTAGRPLDILDLGAGNCWMSYRLGLRGHHVTALDIFNDELDGLHARQCYPLSIPAVEGDFDFLPFGPNTFDIVIFNASIHYSTDYVRTLGEVRRCLRATGHVVVLDTPVYSSPEHGFLMVEERKSTYRQRFGFASDAMGSIEYLDSITLRRLAKELSIRWNVYRPWYGWRWHVRPLIAALRRRRPPSRFLLLAGTFNVA